jgi:hypothetical protein
MFDTLPSIQLFPFNVKFFGNLRSKSVLPGRLDARESTNSPAGEDSKPPFPDQGAPGCFLDFREHDGQDNPEGLNITRPQNFHLFPTLLVLHCARFGKVTSGLFR